MFIYSIKKTYLEKIMKNLLAIIVFSLSSSYLSAAENSIPASTGSSSSAHDKLASFNPSIKATVGRKESDQKSLSQKRLGQKSLIQKKIGQKELLSKNDGQILISRRSQLNKSRIAELALKSAASPKKFRSELPVLSSQAFGFSFYSATSFLDVDLDGDGYYSQFGIDFDADFDSAAFKDVYAIIYYSENGGPWTEFFVTEDFTIFSNDSDDEYSVTFNLTSDFPANEYDFLIDLFEVGFDDIVATVGPNEDADLFALPLEDEISDTLISYVGSRLFGDSDADGFYTDLTLEYDIETQYSGDTVYAEIVMINRAEGWQQALFSDDFTLGNQTEFVDLTFNEGYPAGYYDIQINLIDALTGEVIADAADEFSSLVSLPIESTNNDRPETEVDIVVHGGGGSFGWSVIFLGLLGLVKRRG